MGETASRRIVELAPHFPGDVGWVGYCPSGSPVPLHVAAAPGGYNYTSYRRELYRERSGGRHVATVTIHRQDVVTARSEAGRRLRRETAHIRDPHSILIQGPTGAISTPYNEARGFMGNGLPHPDHVTF